MITEHPEWYIQDSSKLSDWCDCNRMYFFKHVLGWKVDRPEHHMYFGECWHMAREHQLIHGYDDVQGAYAAFINHYRKKFPELTDDMYKPKDPMGVVFALNKFAQERQSDLRDNKLLFTEVSGTVPIDEKGRVLYYRMDSVLQNKESGRIFSWDHKSATEKSMNFPWWSTNFFLSIQNGTYTHCLYCMYPIEQVIGIEFCGTSFHYLTRGSSARAQGYHIGFKRVPAWKTPEQMNVWLWSVVSMLDDIDRDFDRLSKCSEGDAVMMCFPINPGSCSKYFGCAFHDYCMAWPNPLRHCSEPPLGFRQEFWDPRKMETTNKINLDWK